jgi:SAM-dependent methyltransferase
MESAREAAERATEDGQDRNAAWWNALPMTYRPWQDSDRTDLFADDFAALLGDFLNSNPWFGQHFQFSRHAGQRVLEIGCGAGAATCLFRKAGANVTAIDLTEGAVELTTRNVDTHGLDVDVQQMDAEHLAFEHDTFDFVFSWGVLHHSDDTEAAYREAARVLKPSGTMLTMVYNRTSFRYYVRGLQWLLLKGKIRAGDRLPSVQRFYTDGYYHRHFTRREMTALHNRVGLTVDKISITHMAKRMAPAVPLAVDELLKRHGGWLMVVEAHKP